MNKTPYELRYDLLAMAQGILTEQNINKRIQIENDWNMQCEAVRVNAERGHDGTFPRFPEVPSISAQDIIEMAKKLNEFVSNTGE